MAKTNVFFTDCQYTREVSLVMRLMNWSKPTNFIVPQPLYSKTL